MLHLIFINLCDVNTTNYACQLGEMVVYRYKRNYIWLKIANHGKMMVTGCMDKLAWDDWNMPMWLGTNPLLLALLNNIMK